MTLNFKNVVLGTAFLAAYSANAQSNKANSNTFQDALLDKLTGKWKLTGTIGTRKVANHFSAQWILNHQFLELNFEDTARPSTYAAKVLIGFDRRQGVYVAHWMDSFGGSPSKTLGYGKKDGQNISFQFDYPDGTMINLFTYHPQDDSWQFHMTSKNAQGAWEVFGDEYLYRK